jgi:hypothetical protein
LQVAKTTSNRDEFELFFVQSVSSYSIVLVLLIDGNINCIFVSVKVWNLFELMQNALNEIKHRKVYLEQFLKEKVEL